LHRATIAEFQPILEVIEISKTSSAALDKLFRGDVPEDFPTATRWQRSMSSARTRRSTVRGLPEFLQF
jgi:hypothetical protein